LPIKEVGEAHGCLFCDPAKAKRVFAPFIGLLFLRRRSISAGFYFKEKIDGFKIIELLARCQKQGEI